jgi:hypothetical protein
MGIYYLEGFIFRFQKKLYLRQSWATPRVVDSGESIFDYECLLELESKNRKGPSNRIRNPCQTDLYKNMSHCRSWYATPSLWQ